jgi:glycosyltransferase involved in cell wall biosynthesis
MSARVAISIPTYNRLRYLRPCLASIKAQTFTDIALYIFDDCSTEDIKGEVQKLFGDRCTFVPAERNQGAARNIDRAIQFPYAEEFVMIFHDDDTMHPTLIEREVEQLDRNSNAVFIGSNISFCKDEGPLSVFPADAEGAPVVTFYPSAPEFVCAILKSIHIGFGSILYRRQSLSSSLKLDTNRFGPHGDRPFLVQLAKNGGCLFIENRLVNYRIHAAQDSQSTHSVEPLRTNVELMKFYREQLEAALTPEKQKLFIIFSSNNILDVFVRHAPKDESLFGYLRPLQQQRLFSFAAIRLAGFRALIRLCVRRIILRN